MSCRPSNHRAGFAYRTLVVIFALISIVGAVAWLMANQVDWSPAETGPMMHTVKRGHFVHELIEKGEVESASNVEIRCEVQARGMGGTTILWIIPEGTYVKPGDELVRFDSSAMEKELNQQMIVCTNSKANVVAAQNDLDAAKIGLKEYLEGTYVLQRNQIELKKFTASEAQRQAEQNLKYSEGLARKGYVTDLRVKTDQIAVEKAVLDYQSAVLELEILDKYTKEKELKLLDSSIRSAQARVDSAEAAYKLDIEQRDLVKSQIEKCMIHAESTGQVVYANEYRRHGGQDIVIEEGTTVREHQTVIRLPDPKRMQVSAKINEAKIAMVREGMPAVIVLDALSDRELEGVVERVNEYPAPTSFWAANIKEYETFVKILGSPEGLKPGLSAQVRIQVESLPNVIEVPVQAVFEHGKQQYCVMREGEGWRAQEVKIGSTNDKFIVITEGLKEGDEVVLGAFDYRDKVKLPKLAKKEPRVMKSRVPTPGEAEPAAKPAERPNRPDPFAQFDKDGNGKIEKSEAPEQMQAAFPKLDKDGDGAISREELSELRKMMGPGQGKPPRGDRP